MINKDKILNLTTDQKVRGFDSLRVHKKRSRLLRFFAFTILYRVTETPLLLKSGNTSFEKSGCVRLHARDSLRRNFVNSCQTRTL